MIKVINDIQLSHNFKLSEFVCKNCCNQVIISEIHIKKLQLLRDRYGKINISSAYRCLEKNRRIGSKDSSQHVLGTATDITCSELTIDELYKYCCMHFDGVGIYNNFIHCDSRGYAARWDKRKNEYKS